MPDPLVVSVPADTTQVVLNLEQSSGGGGESADLTTIPPAASITNSGKVYTLVNGQCVINDKVVADTHGVQQMKNCLHPSYNLAPGVYQYNGREWWGPVTAASGGPHVPGDPGSAPVAGGVPPQAHAVGYDTLTFGPELVMNQNWFLFDHYGPQNAGVVTQLENGTLRCNGGGTNNFNAHICTARSAGGTPNWRGLSFGGGAYFEARLSWPNPYQQVNGWPSFWGNECNNEAYGNRQWPGQAPGYKDAMEQDYMEWWSQGNYGGAMHRWYQESQDHVEGTSVNVTNDGGMHNYGFLWVPSSVAGGNGYGVLYYDDVEKKRWTWPPYNASKGPPPTDISCMDVTHQALILGTSSANPMTVAHCKVWQRNTSGNILRP